MRVLDGGTDATGIHVMSLHSTAHHHAPSLGTPLQGSSKGGGGSNTAGSSNKKVRGNKATRKAYSVKPKGGM